MCNSEYGLICEVSTYFKWTLREVPECTYPVLGSFGDWLEVVGEIPRE